MGNLGSVVNMLKKIGADVCVTSDKERIGMANKIILPGVGSFDHGMSHIKERGLYDPLNEHALVKKKPILGICLGMQLLTRQSEEGGVPGFGWIDADTVRFNFGANSCQLKIPHMGWNIVNIKKAHPLLKDFTADRESRFYFVHSYHVLCDKEEDVLTTTKYGYDFTSSVAKENIMGAQYHPEKSHKFGMRLLKNFVELI